MTSEKEPDWDLHLSNAIEGDKDSLTLLLNKYGPLVRIGIGDLIGQKYNADFDADDVMSVTYCEAFLGIKRFKPDGTESFVAWLNKIARNNIRDAIRSLNAEKRIPRSRIAKAASDRKTSLSTLLSQLSGALTSVSQAAQGEEARLILENAMSHLPGEYRRVLQLYDLEEMEIARVCELLGRSKGSVYMVRARAIQRLRSMLPNPSRF